ncbi:MAG: hypothetical protein GEU75_15720 [Dehalococcoidia bacterium]|nr:hypothetical protein [Dehalococcoidia bacterium]
MADINLITTAVTSTPVTIATLRTRLRRELHDEDEANQRWADDTLDRHLTRAVRELSLVSPREQKASLSTAAGSRDVSLSALLDLIRVEAVEYPTGRWPPSYVQFSIYQSTLTLLTEAAPGGVEALNVYWGRIHTLDTGVSTLPSYVEDVAVTGAAGYAALEWASFATNRANVAGSSAFEGYQAWGEERLKQFREALRGFGREARVRNATMYRPDRDGSRSTVQWPG